MKANALRRQAETIDSHVTGVAALPVAHPAPTRPEYIHLVQKPEEYGLPTTIPIKDKVYSVVILPGDKYGGFSYHLKRKARQFVIDANLDNPGNLALAKETIEDTVLKYKLGKWTPQEIKRAMIAEIIGMGGWFGFYGPMYNKRNVQMKY